MHLRDKIDFLILPQLKVNQFLNKHMQGLASLEIVRVILE